MLDYKLLNEVRKQFLKKAYIPAPFDPNMIDPTQGVPNQGMPNQGVPNQGMPNQGMPNQGMPNQGMPNQGMPNQGMPIQGMPIQGMPGQPPQIDPSSLIQDAMEALSQGADPNQMAQFMLQKGLPPELIDQVMQAAMSQLQQGEPQGTPQEAPVQEPPNIREQVESYANEEIKKLKQTKMNPEERILMIEKKLDALIDLVQELVSGAPTKEAELQRDTMENLELLQD